MPADSYQDILHDIDNVQKGIVKLEKRALAIEAKIRRGNEADAIEKLRAEITK